MSMPAMQFSVMKDIWEEYGENKRHKCMQVASKVYPTSWEQPEIYQKATKEGVDPMMTRPEVLLIMLISSVFLGNCDNFDK